MVTRRLALALALVVAACAGHPHPAPPANAAGDEVTLYRDAAFIHPTSGSHPGVIIWPDAFGLRPAMVDMGKRIAAVLGTAAFGLVLPAGLGETARTRIVVPARPSQQGRPSGQERP